MKSYKAEELFDKNGRLIPELTELAPKGERRMGANPHANGGILLRDLRIPDCHMNAVNVPSPGAVDGQDTLVLGQFLRDVAKLNQDQRNFRIFGPDETLSDLLGAVFETTSRQWDARVVQNDEFLAPAGRVLDSMLSEHQCEGWLEGYLLTGRHGLFNSYETFIRIVDSMFSQHDKWLKVTLELPWRRKIASLNYLLASHVWRQDHNGFSHQVPGFIDHVANKKADVVRIYLPLDANCLLSVADHCLRGRDYVNLMVLQPQSEHPHGLTDPEFDALFTTDKPVIFAFHGDLAIIHKLTYRRRNHGNIHVRAYNEEGTMATPFGMVVLNNLDHYQLALDAIRPIPRLGDQIEEASTR